MGIDIKIGETALYDYLNIPLFAFLVDHPMYHLNRLNRGVKNLIVSCVDRTHVDFLKRFLNGEYTKVFIPHGAPFRPHPDSGRSVGKRNIDILFAGTVFNPDSYREKWSAGGRSIARLYDEIMERYLSGHDRTLIMAAEDVFEERGIDTEYLNHYRFWENLVYVDLYVRNKRRLDVIRRLSKLGLRIEIFGNGWEPDLDRHPSVKFYPSLPFERVQEKMADAKVVLNILPTFHEGGHERIFSAMLNGAVCLSSGNSYLRREFREGEDILFYAFGQDLEEVLGEYFNDEEKNAKDRGQRQEKSHGKAYLAAKGGKNPGNGRISYVFRPLNTVFRKTVYGGFFLNALRFGISFVGRGAEKKAFRRFRSRSGEGKVCFQIKNFLGRHN